MSVPVNEWLLLLQDEDWKSDWLRPKRWARWARMAMLPSPLSLSRFRTTSGWCDNMPPVPGKHKCRCRPYLMEMLRGQEGKGRAAAADTLARMGPEAKVAIPLLMELLHDNDGECRRAAIYALNWLGVAKSAATAITGLLRDQEADVRIGRSRDSGGNGR